MEAITTKNLSETMDEVLLCSQHPDKVLELYCRGCNCLVCFACALKDHPLHDTETIQDSIDASLPEIFESNEKVDERVKILQAQIKGVMKTIEETRERFATHRIELDNNLQKVS